MDLLNKTRELCELYDIKPSRSKGQNFLISSAVYEKIISAAQLQATDFVLEVGPGLGFLTARLAQVVDQVMAVELDDKLFSALRTGLDSRGVKNVQLFHEDILRFDTRQLPEKYRIVANLPYNITSIFLRQFWTLAKKPQSMTLLLQKEVAERIVAKAGQMSLLAVSVQFYGQPELVQVVPAEDFYPAPKVDSAIIKITLHRQSYLSSVQEEKLFFRLLKIGFSAKRKMLKNNLAGGLRKSQSEMAEFLQAAGFNPQIRAQELSISDWLKLFAGLRKNMV